MTEGLKFMFVGAATGIRNSRGHDANVGDILDYLALTSLLLRRLNAAGLRQA